MTATVLQQTLRLAVTCATCRERVAIVSMPYPPALAIPDVLEFAVKAIVTWLAKRFPPVRGWYDLARRGDWHQLSDELSTLAEHGNGLTVECESCRRRERGLVDE